MGTVVLVFVPLLGVVVFRNGYGKVRPLPRKKATMIEAMVVSIGDASKVGVLIVWCIEINGPVDTICVCGQDRSKDKVTRNDRT